MGIRVGQRSRRARYVHERAATERAMVDMLCAPPSMLLVTRLLPLSPGVGVNISVFRRCSEDYLATQQLESELLIVDVALFLREL